jgi:hypothetical protein
MIEINALNKYFERGRGALPEAALGSPEVDSERIIVASSGTVRER